MPQDTVPFALRCASRHLHSVEEALWTVVSSGLLGQPAGMLANGGQLTLELMRVGDHLMVGIFPKPHPGE